MQSDYIFITKINKGVNIWKSSINDNLANMPRAERGSAKDVSNRMKAKGLGRLRWYCQVCEKQMRDENGFKVMFRIATYVI